MALCINLKSVQVSLGALSWTLLFWGSKEEHANCTITERFLSIFWAFFWCFQRYHWISKKCHILVEPKHQHFKPPCAILGVSWLKSVFHQRQVDMKVGKTILFILPLFMFYILSRRFLKTSAVVRTSWSMFDRNRRDISAYEEQRALLIAWPYKYRYSIAKAILKRRVKIKS